MVTIITNTTKCAGWLMTWVMIHANNDELDQNYIFKHEIEICPKCFPKSAKYEIVFSVLFIDFQKSFQREWFSEFRGTVFHFD